MRGLYILCSGKTTWLPSDGNHTRLSMTRSTLQWITAAAFVACGAALFATLYSAAVHLRTIDAADQELRAIASINVEVEALQSDLLEAQSSLRGHLLTGDIDYLAPYHAATQRMEDQTARVQQVAEAELPEGAEDAYLAAVQAQSTLMASLLDTFRHKGGAAVLADLDTGDGRNSMRDVRDGRRALLNAAFDAAREAREGATLAREQAGRSVLGGGLLAALTLLLAVASTVADTQRLRAAQDEAHELAELLAEQEDVALRLNGARDVATVLHIAATEGRRLTRSEVFAVVLDEPGSYAVATSSRSDALNGWNPQTDPPRGLPTGGAPRVVERGPHRGPHRLEGPDDLQRTTTVPIPGALRDRTIGYLMAAEPWRPLTDADQAVLASLARTVGVAVANVHLLENLREESTRREAFIGLLGHELRNPLNGIAGAAQLLERLGTQDGDRQRTLVDMVARQSRQMRRLVDDLLDVERIRVGKLELHLATDDLVPLIENVVADARTAQGDGAAVVARLPTFPVHARIDATRITQCLHNLVDNARRAAPRDSTVAVCLHADGDEVVLQVLDEGPGFQEATIPHLFDPFEQGRRDGRGLGLGLAIVRGLVQQHDGEVSARNRAEGGACVELRLPRITSPTSLHARRVTPAPLDDLRIVIVDDRADAREVLRTLFEGEGRIVHTADNGRDGLALVRQVRPDIVLCDIGLGGDMNGHDVARALRADPSTQALPLVAVTGYTTDLARKTALEAGFDRHLAKPLDLDEVLRTVDELLRVAVAS